MSDLSKILRTNEEAIFDALAQMLKRSDLAAFVEDETLGGRTLLRAMITWSSDGDQSALRAWVKNLFDRTASGELQDPQLLAGLRCLEKAIRDCIVTQLDDKRQLLAALEQLHDGIDLVHRLCAEQGQARHTAQLQQANKELQQFAYAASHDLQEPLRKIRTFGDRLKAKCADVLDEAGRDCLHRMLDAATRMQAMIDALLTLSRVTTQSQEFVPVDLHQVATEVVLDLQPKIESAGARVEIEELPTIQADPLQMRQLFERLLDNALKFRRKDEPPLVKVHAEFVTERTSSAAQKAPSGERCRIVVEDNGIGFDEKYLDRIFTVFQRLHPRDVYPGTGVGLAICQKIVHRHGGTITARSKPAEGSQFVVMLPVEDR